MILLDTSILVNFLRGDKTTVKTLGAYRKKKQSAGISVVSLAEIEVGFHRRRFSKSARDTLEKLISQSGLAIYPFDTAVVAVYGRLQAKLLDRGMGLSGFDGVIAATAQAHDLSLMTRDNDFRRVPGLRTIKL